MENETKKSTLGSEMTLRITMENEMVKEKILVKT
jgi:hypothetical protein